MADTSVAVTAGSGTNIDTRTESTNGNHRQVVVLGDPSTNAGVAPVDATSGLKVDLGADNDVTVTGTVDLGATDNAVLDTIAAKDFATQTTLSAINTKLTSGTVIGDVNLGATDNAVLDAIAASLAGTLTVTGGGGGVEYTEGATDATITGSAAMMEVAADTLQPIQGTVVGGLLVNLGTNNDVTVTGTVDLGATDNAVLDTIAAKDFATQTTLAAMNAKMVSGTDIGDVTINNASGAAAVNIQDGGNSITVDGTVAVSGTVTVGSHAVTNAGTFLVQNNAATPAGTNNIGDVDVLTVNGVAPAFGTGLRGATVQRVTIATDDSVPVTGTFWQATQPVSLASVPSHAVTATDLDIRNLVNTDVVTAELSAVDNAVLDTIAAKDFATQTTLAAMNAKMVSGTDIGDVTINNASGASAVNIQDGGNTITVDGTVAVTNAGITTIAGAVSGTEMQVDVLTMPTVTVNSHAVTNTGTFAVQATGTVDLGATDNAVLDAIAASVAAIDTDTSTIITNTGAATTALQIMDDWDNAASDGASVSGDVAHDTADAGEPVKVGGVATVTEQTAVSATGDRVNASFTSTGKQIQMPYTTPEYIVSGAITSAMTGTTSTSLVAAPAAGLRNYLTTIIVSNAHATIGTDVVIQDGSGGTTLLTIPAAAVYGGAVITLPTPLRQPTTATAIYCANVTTGASTKVSAVGWKGI